MPSYGLLTNTVIETAEAFMHNVEFDETLNNLAVSEEAIHNDRSWQYQLNMMLMHINDVIKPVKPEELNDNDRRRSLESAVRAANAILTAFHTFEDAPEHAQDVEDCTPAYRNLRRAADAAMQVFALNEMLQRLAGERKTVREANEEVGQANKKFADAQKNLADCVEQVNALRTNPDMGQIRWSELPMESSYVNGIPNAEQLAVKEGIGGEFEGLMGFFEQKKLDIDETTNTTMAFYENKKAVLYTQLQNNREKSKLKLDSIDLNLRALAPKGAEKLLNASGKNAAKLLEDIEKFNREYMPENIRDEDLNLGLKDTKAWQKADSKELDAVLKHADSILKQISEDENGIRQREDRRDAKINQLRSEAENLRNEGKKYNILRKLNLYAHIPDDQELTSLALTSDEKNALTDMRALHKDAYKVGSHYRTALEKCKELAADFRKAQVNSVEYPVHRSGRWDNSAAAFEKELFYKEGTLDNLLNSIDALTNKTDSDKYEKEMKKKINDSSVPEELRDAFRNELEKYHKLCDHIRRNLDGVDELKNKEIRYNQLWESIMKKPDSFAAEADKKDREIKELNRRMDYEKEKAALQRKKNYLTAVKDLAVRIQKNSEGLKNLKKVENIRRFQNEKKEIENSIKAAQNEYDQTVEKINSEKNDVRLKMEKEKDAYDTKKSIIAAYKDRFSALEKAAEDLKNAGAEVTVKEQAASEARTAEEHYMKKARRVYVQAVQYRAGALLRDLKNAKKKYFSDTTEFTDMVKAVTVYCDTVNDDMTAEQLAAASETALTAVNHYIVKKTKEDISKTERSTGAGKKRMDAALQLVTMLTGAARPLKLLEADGKKIPDAEKSQAAVKNMCEYRILHKAGIKVGGMEIEDRDRIEKAEKELLDGRNQIEKIRKNEEKLLENSRKEEQEEFKDTRESMKDPDQFLKLMEKRRNHLFDDDSRVIDVHSGFFEKDGAVWEKLALYAAYTEVCSNPELLSKNELCTEKRIYFSIPGAVRKLGKNLLNSEKMKKIMAEAEKEEDYFISPKQLAERLQHAPENKNNPEKEPVKELLNRHA